MSSEEQKDQMKSLTVAKLRARLKAKGLDTKGKKAQLVARLTASLEAEEAVPVALAGAEESTCLLSNKKRQRGSADEGGDGELHSTTAAATASQAKVAPEADAGRGEGEEEAPAKKARTDAAADEEAPPAEIDPPLQPERRESVTEGDNMVELDYSDGEGDEGGRRKEEEKEKEKEKEEKETRTPRKQGKEDEDAGGSSTRIDTNTTDAAGGGGGGSRWIHIQGLVRSHCNVFSFSSFLSFLFFSFLLSVRTCQRV